MPAQDRNDLAAVGKCAHPERQAACAHPARRRAFASAMGDGDSTRPVLDAAAEAAAAALSSFSLPAAAGAVLPKRVSGSVSSSSSSWEASI